MEIVLIEEPGLVRDSIRLIIERQYPDCVIIEAERGEQVLDGSDWPAPDLVLIDLDVAEMNGADLLRAFVRRWPQSPIVVLSGTDDLEAIRQAVQLGARGYLTEAVNTRELIEALERVLAGGTHLPAYARDALARMPAPELTPRQLAVLRLLVHGLPNPDIAEALGMAVSTVRGHVSDLLCILNASNRTEAARIAIERGLATRFDDLRDTLAR